jgi:hypothetical protein
MPLRRQVMGESEVVEFLSSRFCQLTTEGRVKLTELWHARLIRTNTDLRYHGLGFFLRRPLGRKSRCTHHGHADQGGRYTLQIIMMRFLAKNNIAVVAALIAPRRMIRGNA